MLPSCVGTIGVNNWDETLDSVPATVVAPVRARSNGASAISFFGECMGMVWRDSASYSRFCAWGCAENFDGVFTVEIWP